MANKKIKTKDLTQKSVRSGQPKSKNWWEKTKWLRWTLGFLLTSVALIVPFLFNDKGLNTENSPLSINTIAQTGDNSINIGTQQRNITQDTKNKLSGVLPKDKNQTIVVNSIDGDAEAFRFAIQIKEYLESLGYPVAGVNKRIYSPKDYTDTLILTNSDGSLKEILVGRQP